jgi:hypothetical protein
MFFIPGRRIRTARSPTCRTINQPDPFCQTESPPSGGLFHFGCEEQAARPSRHAQFGGADDRRLPLTAPRFFGRAAGRRKPTQPPEALPWKGRVKDDLRSWQGRQAQRLADGDRRGRRHPSAARGHTKPAVTAAPTANTPAPTTRLAIKASRRGSPRAPGRRELE